MLERYFVRPATINRIHSCWLGKAIDRYVTWLVERGYAAHSVLWRVPLLVRFGEFTHRRGASNWSELPEHIEPFIENWLKRHGQEGVEDPKRRAAARTIRNPIKQLVRLILPGGPNDGRSFIEPFADNAPAFFPFLREQRGLQKATIVQYHHYLLRLEGYLRNRDIQALAVLSPAMLDAFISEVGRALDKRSVQSLCSILKVFLRYLYYAGLHARDLSLQIESPRRYRLANLPRSISWDEVRQMLETVDRSTPKGKRDFAILLLLVTYGLRAREVANPYTLKRSDGLVRLLYGEIEEASRIDTVPGFATTLSVLVAVEIADIKRFPTVGDLHSYAGVIPSTYASGERTHHGRITKQGSAWLRWAALEAAYPAIKKDLGLRVLYNRLAKRKGANVAKIAVARRLLTIIYRVLTEKREYIQDMRKSSAA